ncbi:MAG TPA: ACT domain-containing protein, partial [Pyrinomonadaceae bacterium]|nr:ACT domain-containing protein [Pyrinomonadaceae bacterium]
RVGTILGDRGVNISRFHLGRRERGGEAMAVIEVDGTVDLKTLEALSSHADVLAVREIQLS